MSRASRTRRSPLGAAPEAAAASEALEPPARRGRFAILSLRQPRTCEKTGDAEHLGRAWAGVWRAAVGPTLANATNPDRDRAAVIDDLYSRFTMRIAASPRRQQGAIAVVIVRKTDDAA